jgi:ADP-ribose pyrophosphatase YjhB (NUDIX family)
MTDTPLHSVSVAAAIFDDSGENVLLIRRRDNGKWEPPGGVLELDETIEEGLRREVREETGAEIEVGPLTGVYKNMPLGIVALVFRASLAQTPRAETLEAARVEWVRMGDVHGLMAPVYAVRITDAALIEWTQVRTHDGRRIL